MSVTLLPRLGQIAVDQVLDEYGDSLSLSSSLDFVRRSPESMSYAASGGSPLKREGLLEIRRLLVAAAEENGFPDRGSTKERAQFDTDLARLLGEHPHFTPPEALRDDVWAFLTAVVAPDIVNWRFGTSARERYHGGVRNTFQRLWMRAWSLDRGPGHEDRWGLIRDLTEDAFVQIVERPSIGGDRRIARALAEGWVRMSEKAGRGAMEAIMRRAVIAFRLRNQIQLLAALGSPELRDAVDDAFERARASLNLPTLETAKSDLAVRTDRSSDSRPDAGLPGGAQTPEKRDRRVFSRFRALIGRGKDAASSAPQLASRPDKHGLPGSTNQHGDALSLAASSRSFDSREDGREAGIHQPPKAPGSVSDDEKVSEQLDELLEKVAPVFPAEEMGTSKTRPQLEEVPALGTPKPGTEAGKPGATHGHGLVWKEITLPEGTAVSMRYGGEDHVAEVSRGSIVDSDGEFTPSEWANKVANNTSRNAWRDVWFRKPGEADWVLADELRARIQS